jgi:transposase-like protein
MGKRTTTTLSELGERRRWSEDEGRQVVEAWEASGESVARFARQVGLAAQRVSWWKKRLGGSGTEQLALPPAAAFVPVTVRAEAVQLGSAAITVMVGEGLRLEVADMAPNSAMWVATLVKTLREVRL